MICINLWLKEHCVETILLVRKKFYAIPNSYANYNFRYAFLSQHPENAIFFLKLDTETTQDEQTEAQNLPNFICSQLLVPYVSELASSSFLIPFHLSVPSKED